MAPDCWMSNALPAATCAASSMSSTRATRSPWASASATAPPSSPAPMMHTVGVIWCGILVRHMALGGKVAIVTGGSRGIGFATARALTAQGASVAIVGTDQARLDAAARELGQSTMAIRADVRRHDDVERAVSNAVSRFGRLDVLVNNAGIGVYRPVSDMTVDEWNRTFETNVRGMFYCCHAALPHLKQS